MEEFQIVKRKKLFESFNPRKRLDAKADAELAESIRQKGILQPLLVRPRDSGYEIIFGGRRFKAAGEAGVEDIPIRIKDMGDKEVLEVQMIENLQRGDIHPLDEAEGYRKMLQWKYDVAGIAAKIGKSQCYVYARLKLTELIPEVKKAFLEDKITAGHAVLIARLQPKDQKEALETTLEESFRDDIMSVRIMSVRELMHWIEQAIHLDLHSSPFQKDDCKICPKRTGFLPDLFPDVKKKDTCTDPACFKAKIEEHIKAKIEEQEESTGEKPLKLTDQYYGQGKEGILNANHYHIIEKKNDYCEHAKKGIIVEGREKGKVLTVCADKNCKVHTATGRYGGLSPAEIKKQKAEKEKEKLKISIREKVYAAVLENIPKKLESDDMAFICNRFFQFLTYEYQQELCKRLGIEIKKEQYGLDLQKSFAGHIAGREASGYSKLLIELALLPTLQRNPYTREQPDYLLETAERYGIDHKTIEEEMTTEFKAKKAKGEERKARKEKKTKKEKH